MNWVSIDLGTCYSSATVLIGGKPEKVRPLDNVYGQYAFPTVAYVSPRGELYVCGEALKWKKHDPQRFIKEFKLDIHQRTIADLGVSYADIIARILGYIKRSAEAALGGEPIAGTLLTVPASYDETDPRLEIMRKAARLAGFTEVRVLAEPVAAALYYHSLQRGQANTVTLVYDLGGGTFDPALIRHAAEGYEVLGNAEGLSFGGKYFDGLIVRHFIEKCGFEFSSEEALQVREMEELQEMCRAVKEQLSVVEKVDYPVPYREGMLYSLTRDEFSELIRPSVIETFEECSSLLDSAGKQWDEVDRILLVGGSSYIPCIKKWMLKYLEGKNAAGIPVLHGKSDENIVFDPLYAISLGGSVYLRDQYSAAAGDPAEAARGGTTGTVAARVGMTRTTETRGTPEAAGRAAPTGMHGTSGTGRMRGTDRTERAGRGSAGGEAGSPGYYDLLAPPFSGTDFSGEPSQPSSSRPPSQLQPPASPAGSCASGRGNREKGLYYKTTGDGHHNWLLAALYLSKAYREYPEEATLDGLIEIFQVFADGMSWDEARTSFSFDMEESLLECFGAESREGFYLYLAALQTQYDRIGGEALYAQCFDIYFWMHLTLALEDDLLALFG